MAGPTKRFTAWLSPVKVTPEQKAQLHKYAADHNLPVSVIMRTALDEYLRPRLEIDELRTRLHLETADESIAVTP